MELMDKSFGLTTPDERIVFMFLCKYTYGECVQEAQISLTELHADVTRHAAAGERRMSLKRLITCLQRLDEVRLVKVRGLN